MYEAKKAAFILYSRYEKAREENGYRDERDLDTSDLMAQFGPYNKLMHLLKYAGYPGDRLGDRNTPEKAYKFFQEYEGKTNRDFIGDVTEFFQEADPNGLIEIGSGSVLPKF